MEKMEATYNNLMFRIECDLPEVGAYLYVFKNNKCVEDHLQDSVDMCKEFALEEYGVPINIWQKVEN